MIASTEVSYSTTRWIDALDAFKYRVQFINGQLFRHAEYESEELRDGACLCPESWKKSNDVLFGISDLLDLALDDVNRQIAELEAKRKDEIAFESPKSFEPALTNDEVEEMEKRLLGNMGVFRRVSLIALTKASAELHQIINDDPNSFVSMVEMAGEHLSYTKACVELAETAFARLAMVGQAQLSSTGMISHVS